MKKESSVEQQLDEFRQTYSEHIWEVKPKHEGVGTDGKPDRVWCVKGFTIGIEAKRIMSKDNQSTLPTVLQTRELQDLIEAGGAGCVVDLESVGLFLSEMFDVIIDEYEDFPQSFIDSINYKEVFCIDNWARLPETVKID